MSLRAGGSAHAISNPGCFMSSKAFTAVSRKRKTSSIVAVLALATPLLASSPLYGCGDDSGPVGGGLSEEELAERQEIASSIGENVVMPLLQTCSERAQELKQAVDAHVSEQTVESLSSAREAWVSAFSAWQQCELLQFGPAGMATTSAGGLDLRDPIYSWPLSNPCVADIAIVDGSYDDGELADALNVNARGLDTLEYLLFGFAETNTCAPNNRINADGTWDALGEETREERRLAYASRVAAEVASVSAELHNTWDDSFLTELEGTGSAGVYRNAQEALNAISDAMFYLEKETKDMKMALPAGISGCIEETCLDDVESRFAAQSLEAIIANTEAFAMIYYGGEVDGDSPGFDDLLRSIGASEVAETMEAQIDDALARLTALPTPLEAAIVDEPEAFADAFEAMRELNVTLKTSFVGVLDLELPQRAEGDND